MTKYQVQLQRVHPKSALWEDCSSVDGQHAPCAGTREQAAYQLRDLRKLYPANTYRIVKLVKEK